MTVTKRIAECLYVAISTDTGCFKFSNTTSNTHRTAAALIEAGADVYPINKLFFDTKSFSRLRMEAKLTETMEFYADGTVGVCVMPKRLLAEFSATEDDLDSISGFARSIEGVRIGVMIREVEDDSVYDRAVEKQVEEVKATSKIHCVDDLLRSGATWEVE